MKPEMHSGPKRYKASIASISGKTKNDAEPQMSRLFQFSGIKTKQPLIGEIGLYPAKRPGEDYKLNFPKVSKSSSPPCISKPFLLRFFGDCKK